VVAAEELEVSVDQGISAPEHFGDGTGIAEAYAKRKTGVNLGSGGGHRLAPFRDGAAGSKGSSQEAVQKASAGGSPLAA
jgi:hypothetical protein